MSNDAFLAIKQLLVPYAKNFKVWTDDATTYDLEEDLPYSRTMFAYLSVSRGGARLVFYPLQVFPELRDSLPAVLASKLKSKCIFALAKVSPAERAALTKVFRAGLESVEARRALNPGRGYFRKPTLDETFAILAKLVGTSTSATLTRRPKDITLALPVKKVPAVLVPRHKQKLGFVFKTITPAEHDALAKLLQ